MTEIDRSVLEPPKSHDEAIARFNKLNRDPNNLYEVEILYFAGTTMLPYPVTTGLPAIEAALGESYTNEQKDSTLVKLINLGFIQKHSSIGVDGEDRYSIQPNVKVFCEGIFGSGEE